MAPRRSSRRTASAAAAGPSDSAAGPSAEPAELRFLDLPPELIAEVLALVSTADRLRVRCVNKACKSTHAKAGDAVADGLAVGRIGALVAARGRATVAAGPQHTVCVCPADGARCRSQSRRHWAEHDHSEHHPRLLASLLPR